MYGSSSVAATRRASVVLPAPLAPLTSTFRGTARTVRRRADGRDLAADPRSRRRRRIRDVRARADARARRERHVRLPRLPADDRARRARRAAGENRTRLSRVAVDAGPVARDGA